MLNPATMKIRRMFVVAVRAEASDVLGSVIEGLLPGETPENSGGNHVTSQANALQQFRDVERRTF
jgi:hypothetical protein